MDHPTANDLFKQFLSKCEQIDEPEIGRVLKAIREQFEEVDSSYRESEVFKRFLQKVIQNVTAHPWRSMRTVADDLMYHTFQTDTESNDCSDSSNEDAVLDENLDSFSPTTDLESPSSIEPIQRDVITGPENSSLEIISTLEFSSSSDCAFDGSYGLRGHTDEEEAGPYYISDGNSDDSSDYTDEEDEYSDDLSVYTDEEEAGPSYINGGSSDASLYYASTNCSSEVDDEGSHESHESDVDNRGHNQNEFDVEDLVSRVQESFDKSAYDEAECIHLEAQAKVDKYQRIQNLKMELTKLNLDISKMGSHEVRAPSDGISSLSKVRSLMGKYLDVYMKICKLNGETTLVEDVIKFEGTKNVLIDRAIEKFYNERDDMNLPLLDEMCDVIKNVKNDNGESLNLSESKVLEIAIDALQELGRIRRKQRAEEFHDLLSSYSLIGSVLDPAFTDFELRMKIFVNGASSVKRMDLVIEKFENRENIRTSRRSSLRRRSISDSLVELDVGDYLRSMLFPSSDGDE